MELLGVIAELIPTIGFPIVCVILLGWFIFKIYKDSQKEKEVLATQNAANMEKVQARCKEREDKLYLQLEKQNEINGKFANIIAQYDIKLEAIQEDVSEIKNELNILVNK